MASGGNLWYVVSGGKWQGRRPASNEIKGSNVAIQQLGVINAMTAVMVSE